MTNTSNPSMALVEARNHATRSRLDIAGKLLEARLNHDRVKTKAQKAIWYEYACTLSNLLVETQVPPLAGGQRADDTEWVEVLTVENGTPIRHTVLTKRQT